MEQNSHFFLPFFHFILPSLSSVLTPHKRQAWKPQNDQKFPFERSEFYFIFMAGVCQKEVAGGCRSGKDLRETAQTGRGKERREETKSWCSRLAMPWYEI